MTPGPAKRDKEAETERAHAVIDALRGMRFPAVQVSAEARELLLDQLFGALGNVEVIVDILHSAGVAQTAE